jgi:hypothetical protein
MKISARFSLVCSIIASVSAIAAEPRLLFDGKTFDGWEGDKSVFQIKEGAIVGGSLDQPVKHNDFLCTTESFEDFELTCEFKLVGNGANAGIQFRSQRVPQHFEVAGYQADMGGIFWGCLYDESRRNKVLVAPTDKKKLMAAIKNEDWNNYKIRCEGPRIQLWINDIQTVDYTEPDDKISRQGVIGLQIHGGPPSQAWYRNIRLQPTSGK